MMFGEGDSPPPCSPGLGKAVEGLKDMGLVRSTSKIDAKFLKDNIMMRLQEKGGMVMHGKLIDVSAKHP